MTYDGVIPCVESEMLKSCRTHTCLQPVAGAQCASSVCNHSPLISISRAPSVGVAAMVAIEAVVAGTQSMPIARRVAARPQSPQHYQLGDT